MKKILTIDDDQNILRLLEIKLSEAGYAVIKADNAKLGINIALDQKPELILLDILMPEIDGEKATDILKEDKETKDIPIIYITSLLEKNDVNEGFVSGSKIGDQPFISKPFESGELLGMVERYIGKP